MIQVQRFSETVPGAIGVFIRINGQTRACIGIGHCWRKFEYAAGDDALAVCISILTFSYITAFGAKPLPKWIQHTND